MKHNFMNKENRKVAPVLVMCLDDEGHMQTDSYDKVEDLMEDYAAYKPAEPKRYRLIKDLPTFNAGEIFVLENAIEQQGLFRESDDIMAYHQNTLMKFPNILTDWFEPINVDDINVANIPLIKDEKIRKAVKVWAEANDVEKIDYWSSEYKFRDAEGYSEISFESDIIKKEDRHVDGVYTIAELCG